MTNKKIWCNIDIKKAFWKKYDRKMIFKKHTKPILIKNCKKKKNIHYRYTVHQISTKNCYDFQPYELLE